jgi:hypothetical protein
MADTKSERAAKDAVPNIQTRPPATPPDQAPPGAMRDATGQPVGATVPTSYALDKTSEQRTRERNEAKEETRKSTPKRKSRSKASKAERELKKAERIGQQVHAEGQRETRKSSDPDEEGNPQVEQLSKREERALQQPGHFALATAERAFNREIRFQWACPSGEGTVNPCGQPHDVFAPAGYGGKQACQNCGRRYQLVAYGDGSGGAVEMMGTRAV